ncbi:MAG: redoxin domain-containing protein, partial [Phycisphaerae bacterium]|nr:redoxin domain-containing protein [Phycisphaerae bacterium]
MTARRKARAGFSGRGAMSFVLVAVVVWSVDFAARAVDNKPDADGASAASVMIDASVLLVRAPSVQAELQLTDAQRQAVDKLLDEINLPLWALRDLPLDKKRKRWDALAATLEAKVDEVLKPAQCERLDQIVRQARGYSTLSLPDEAKYLSLTDDQRKAIGDTLAKTRRAMAQLNQLEQTGHNQDRLRRLARLARAEQRRDVLMILTDQQEKTWARRLGKPFDFSGVRSVAARAPEFRGDGPWLNSEPLTMSELRGRVVAVHFWTFGCSNCIHNYPWYKGWQEDYADKGLTIVGIHTPETTGEHKVESVQAKAKENGLIFPILIDNDKQ